MASVSEPEWQARHVGGRDLRNGLSERARAGLATAFRLEPGPVPRGEEWQGVLGLEKPTGAGNVGPLEGNKGKAPVAPVREGKVKGGAPLAEAATNGASTMAGPDGKAGGAEGVRPLRANKRRRYDDSSFEGYGDRSFDDEVDDGAYSSDGGSRQSSGSRKKRRKVTPSLPPLLQAGRRQNPASSAGVPPLEVGSC